MNNRKAGYKVLSLGVVGVLSWLDCTPVAQMQPNIPNGGRAVAVSVHPTNVSHIIVASETGGLFKSTDGGASWTQVSGTTTFGYSDVLRSEEHTSELQSQSNLVCRLLLEKKK